jgi:hypothetical protein
MIDACMLVISKHQTKLVVLVSKVGVAQILAKSIRKTLKLLPLDMQ